MSGLIAALIWGIEIAVAVAWLSRFRMGPLEWIWRALTYQRSPGPLFDRPGANR